MGFLRLDLVMRYVWRSAATIFVNALAIMIFISQLPQLIIVTWVLQATTAGGLAIIHLFPRLTKAALSPLVAIAILTIYDGLKSQCQQFGASDWIASRPLMSKERWKPHVIQYMLREAAEYRLAHA